MQRYQKIVLQNSPHVLVHIHVTGRLGAVSSVKGACQRLLSREGICKWCGWICRTNEGEGVSKC